MRSIIMTTAWEYFKTGLFTSFGDAQSAAWETYRLKEAFRTGIVDVSFVKGDGTVSEKRATLSTDFMPVYKSSGKPRKKSVGQIKFYSVDDAAFRSLRIERLQSFKAA